VQDVASQSEYRFPVSIQGETIVLGCLVPVMGGIRIVNVTVSHDISPGRMLEALLSLKHRRPRFV
jgi:hypothetical protein